MKQYLIFAGHNYYPSGGWDDFIDTATSMEEALEITADTKCDWWHIVDWTSQAIIKASHD